MSWIYSYERSTLFYIQENNRETMIRRNVCATNVQHTQYLAVRCERSNDRSKHCFAWKWVRDGLSACCFGMTVSRNDRSFVRYLGAYGWRGGSDKRLSNGLGSYHDLLTGNKRSISTLHLWQKNRDIGVPSTTASAMFYVSVSTSL